MVAESESILTLSSGADSLVASALGVATGCSAEPGANHWILALVKRLPAMALKAGFAADEEGIATLRAEVEGAVKRGDAGPPLGRDAAVSCAMKLAREQGKDRIYEVDLARAILALSGRPFIAPREMPRGDRPSRSRAGAPHARAGALGAGQNPGRPLGPILTEFGRDLTAMAREGRLSEIVQRDEEISLVVETLCRRVARNPALVGPAGVGKTAIVEGLAQRIVRGEVPPLLHNVFVIELQASTLVAGTSLAGKLEERIRDVVVEASRPDVVLFIDEVHSVIGSGGARGVSDIASQLKPALARGELACIAATTDEEYRRYIEADRALERRFQPIRVHEPTPQQTLAILGRLAEEAETSRRVTVGKPVLAWIVKFAEQSLRNRHFPAKAVDLFEQCVARATAAGLAEVSRDHAVEVARRMTGMPVDATGRVQEFAERAWREQLLPKSDIEALTARLEVTMRGFDLRPHRPNAVLLLGGAARASVAPLASMIAEVLLGSPDRVVDIDFGRFMRGTDLAMLLGAPPGYVGYSEHLPIHGLLQTPWSVLRCDNVHSCHTAILEILAQGLENGFITDACGKRIYLSDAIVILSAAVEVQGRRMLGFSEAKDDTDNLQQDYSHLLENVLGAKLVRQCDIICMDRPSLAEEDEAAVGISVLETLTQRYAQGGLLVQWDPSLFPWLSDLRSSARDILAWERLVEGYLGSALTRYEAEAAFSQARRVLVSWRDGAVRVRPLEAGTP